MNCVELSGRLNNKMYSPLSFNSTNYRLLLNLQLIFPGEICFTHLQLCTWAQPQSTGWRSSLLCHQQCWCLVWMQAPAGERSMMSGADLLHPTTKGKTEHQGINSLEQDAWESFSEGREIPCMRHLALGAVTHHWPCPQALPPTRSMCSRHEQAAGSVHAWRGLLLNTTQGLTGITKSVGCCI